MKNEFQNNLENILGKCYDNYFIKILYDDYIDQNNFYQNLLIWLKEEKADDYVNNNKNPFSKFYGISNDNPDDFIINKILHLNKRNVDFITKFLIDSLFELDFKGIQPNLDKIKNKFFQTFDIFIIDEIVFLGNLEENKIEEFPMNFYSFSICLKFLNDVLSSSFKTVSIGLTDYFHQFFNINVTKTKIMNEIFYKDLYFCYVTLILFVKENIHIKQNYNLSLSITSFNNDENFIENFTFNSILFSEYYSYFIDVMKISIENLNLFGIIKNLEIDLNNIEINLFSNSKDNLVDINLLKYFYCTLEKEILFKRIREFELSILVDNNNQILDFLKIAENLLQNIIINDFSIKFLRKVESNENNNLIQIDLSNILNKTNLKHLTIGGEKLQLLYNDKDIINLSILNLLSYNTKIENLNILKKFKNLRELYIKTISYKELENFNQIIQTNFNLIRNLDISLEIKEDQIELLYNIIEKLSLLTNLNSFKLLLTCEDNIITKEDFGLFFIYMMKTNKKILNASLIVQYKNKSNIQIFNSKSKKLFEEKIKHLIKEIKIIEEYSNNTETSRIFIEKLQNENKQPEIQENKETSKKKKKRNKLIEVQEQKEIIYPFTYETPIQYEYQNFESFLYTLHENKIKQNFTKLKRKPILINIFSYLANPVSRIFFTEFEYFN